MLKINGKPICNRCHIKKKQLCVVHIPLRHSVIGYLFSDCTVARCTVL